MKQFKEKAVFDKCFVQASLCGEGLGSEFSEASLDSLRKLELPENINLKENVDLLAVWFNGGVINQINDNGEGMLTETAMHVSNYFVHKPLNIQHKKQHVVGHILNTGWSDRETNKILTNSQVKDMDDPFNLVIGGVVYRIGYPKFIEALIEASDEDSEHYMSISTSWELAFDDYWIALGSKDPKEAEIIKDPKQIAEFAPYLKSKKGSGKLSDGTLVGRLIIGGPGEVVPIGMGFVSRPAADVKGVKVFDFSDLLEEEEEKETSKAENSDAEKLEKENKQENIKNNQENISQKEETRLKENSKKNTNTAMSKNTKKITSVEELLSGEVSEASANEFIQEQIKLKSEEFEQEINAKEIALAEANKRIEALEKEAKKASGLSDQISNLESKLEEVSQAAKAKELDEQFQGRMSALEKDFDLSEKDKGIIVKEIRSLDEESYASWYERFETFAESKKKSVIEANNKKIQEEIERLASEKSEASRKEERPAEKPEISEAAAQEALDDANEPTDSSLPNATPTESKDLAAEFKEQFEDFKSSISLK